MPRWEEALYWLDGPSVPNRVYLFTLLLIELIWGGKGDPLYCFILLLSPAPTSINH